MRTLILLILNLIIVPNTEAQKIHFTDSGNRWFVHQRELTGLYRYKAFFTNDTIVGGKYYRIFVDPRNIGACGIREDTLQQRVYMRHIFSQPPSQDTNEYLVYRYDVQVGDTIQFVNSHPYTDSVIAIDSIWINGVYHKTFTLRDTNPNLGMVHAYTVIEGLGALDGPLYPYYAYCYEAESEVVCFEHNGAYPTIYYQTQNCKRIRTFTNPGTCADSFNLAVLEISVTLSAGLYPNPYTEGSVIQFSQVIANGQVALFNGMGQRLFLQPIRNRMKVSLGNLQLSAGIYYFQVLDQQLNKQVAGQFAIQ